MPTITLSDREFHTTLAALRYWQDIDASFVSAISPGLVDVLTNGGTVEPLGNEEVDALCERINTEPAPATKLAKLLAEALDYKSEQFDGPPDIDLDVSGADLVDWFTGWRRRVRAALAAPEAAPAGLYAALKLVMPLAESHVEDWSTGIEDGTYETPAECAAAESAVEFANAVLAGTAKLPTLAVVLEGGMVQDIVSDAPAIANAALEGIIVIDYDTEGSDGDDVSLVRQSDSTYADAFVHDESIGAASIDLGQVDADDRARDAAIEAGWSYNRFNKTFKHPRGKRTADEEISTWADLCRAESIEF